MGTDLGLLLPCLVRDDIQHVLQVEQGWQLASRIGTIAYVIIIIIRVVFTITCQRPVDHHDALHTQVLQRYNTRPLQVRQAGREWTRMEAALKGDGTSVLSLSGKAAVRC